jgi:hypothetical protein
MMSDGGADEAQSNTPAGGGAPPELNVEQLADKVYRLLQAEVRLGRARGELNPARSTRRSSTWAT